MLKLETVFTSCKNNKKQQQTNNNKQTKTKNEKTKRRKKEGENFKNPHHQSPTHKWRKDNRKHLASQATNNGHFKRPHFHRSSHLNRPWSEAAQFQRKPEQSCRAPHEAATSGISFHNLIHLRPCESCWCQGLLASLAGLGLWIGWTL